MTMMQSPAAVMQGRQPAANAGAPRWIRFELADQFYAVPIESVREVLDRAAIEPVPGAPAAVLGVINLRGQIVTVVDLRRWLGRPALDETHHVLVLEQRGVLLGVAVDAVLEVQRIAEVSIQPMPRTAEPGGTALMHGLVAQDDGLLTLLSLDALLADESP